MRRIWTWIALGTLALGVGCDNGGNPPVLGDDDDGGGNDAYTGPVVGRVQGAVTTPAGVPIEDVEVEIVGVASALTDANGIYVIEGVAPAGTQRVTFHKHGYTSNVRPVEVLGWEVRTINARLLPVDTIGSVRAADGGRVGTDEATVDFRAASFVNEAGVAFDGDVEVTVTHIDPSTDDILAAPNDFLAIGAGGQDTGLESFAMIDVSLSVDGNEVELADGMPADVEMVLAENLPEAQAVEIGDVIPMWSYDEEALRWVQETTATVVPSTTMPGRLAVVAELPHFTPWNADQPVPPDVCISGDVIDVGNNPVIAADIRIQTVDTLSAYNGTTDDAGHYEITIPGGSLFDVRAEVVVGGQTYTAEDGTYGAGTDPSNCTDVPTLQIPTCVVGGVVEVMRQRTYNPMDETMAVDASTGRAYFFEPDGTPETCINIDPTDLPEDTCTMVDSEDELMSFFWGSQPIDVGQVVEVTSGADTMYLDPEERIPGDVFYSGSTSDTQIAFDSRVDIYAYGNQYGLPELDMEGSLPVGAEMAVSSPAVDAMFEIQRGEDLTITTNAGTDSWGTIALITTEDNTNGACLCRFADDGQLTVPGIVTQQLDDGPAAMMLSRVQTEMVALPNGYWARTMGQTATAVIGEVTQ